MVQMNRLPIGEYAQQLCEAISRYDFPPVTYDFGANDYFDRTGFFNGNETRHHDMGRAEKYIRDLLTSGERQDVKDGLSNVLYWGYANQSGRQRYRVKEFRNGVRKCHLDRFAEIVCTLRGPELVRLGRIRCKNGSSRPKNMPGFSGMSFVSKIRMFLDPGNYPVLDMKLAEAFSKCDVFPPLRCLTFRKKSDPGKPNTQISITKHNEQVYEQWAAWCRKIAGLVNAEPTAPCKNLRAVDVERAIFQLEGPNRERAWQLLRGPQI